MLASNVARRGQSWTSDVPAAYCRMMQPALPLGLDSANAMDITVTRWLHALRALNLA